MTDPREAPATADPETIDLDRLRAWQYWEKTGHNYNVLTETIAAVEALRNQGTELESEIEQAIKWQQFYMNKAEASEARADELVEVLTEAIAKCSACGGTEKVATEWTVDGVVGESVAPCPVCKPWRATLADHGPAPEGGETWEVDDD